MSRICPLPEPAFADAQDARSPGSLPSGGSFAACDPETHAEFLAAVIAADIYLERPTQ